MEKNMEKLENRVGELMSDVRMLVGKINRNSKKLNYCCNYHESVAGLCVILNEIKENSIQQVYKKSVGIRPISSEKTLVLAISQLEKIRMRLSMIYLQGGVSK